MSRPIGIGEDDFTALIQDRCFYIDKTMLIKEWWENRDKVTLITRPRHFGKTLNMSMLERFWNNQYAGQGGIFENLAICREEKYRELQEALQQIADKKYEQTLINQGIEPHRIRKYGFAFQGKEVLIG